ncbi:MAG: hypothetical protein V1725_00235 [archaeon]
MLELLIRAIPASYIGAGVSGLFTGYAAAHNTPIEPEAVRNVLMYGPMIAGGASAAIGSWAFCYGMSGNAKESAKASGIYGVIGTITAGLIQAAGFGIGYLAGKM